MLISWSGDRELSRSKNMLLSVGKSGMEFGWDDLRNNYALLLLTFFFFFVSYKFVTNGMSV